MAIEFKEKVRIQTVGSPEVAASRLEAQLNKHFPTTGYDPEPFTAGLDAWRLRDSLENKCRGSLYPRFSKSSANMICNPKACSMTDGCPRPKKVKEASV